MKTVMIHIALVLLFAVCLFPSTGRADTIPVQAIQTASRTVEIMWTEGYGNVDVYRLYPDQSQFSLIASTNSTSWTDHQRRSVCGDTVHYVVTNGIDSGYAAELVTDNDPTSPAEWGVVTMDHSISQIVLQWEPSPDTDIMGYLVLEGMPSMVVDTVFGRLNNLYAYPAEDSVYVHQFRIYAFDSCLRASPLTKPCNNMVVIVENEPCSQTYLATWNRYINMPSEVGSYELWVSQNGGTFQRKAVVQADGETSAMFVVDDECSLLQLYVRAVSASGAYTAVSNLLTIDISSAMLPEKLNLRSVSVEGEQQNVTLVAETDSGWQDSEVVVYRRNEGGNPTVVGRCHPSAQGSISWTDMGAKPGEKIYYYSVGISDICGRNEKRSREACTILPNLETEGGNTALSWNPYTGWDGTTNYKVYSSVSSGGYWQQIGSTTATSLADLTDGTLGQCQYKVCAFEGSDSHYQHGDSVQSAKVYYSPKTRIWMPNAITPLENSNNSAAPQASYINPDGYSFTIYNRQGLVVFRSITIGEAWNGKKNDTLLPAGAYTYIVTYRQSNGTDQVITGTITIIY